MQVIYPASGLHSTSKFSIPNFRVVFNLQGLMLRLVGEPSALSLTPSSVVTSRAIVIYYRGFTMSDNYTGIAFYAVR